MRALRAYEAGLLAAYQAFLRTVLAASGGRGAGALAAATVGGGTSPAATARARAAVRCMAELVTALPHFNFAGDLLRVSVTWMERERERGERRGGGGGRGETRGEARGARGARPWG